MTKAPDDTHTNPSAQASLFLLPFVYHMKKLIAFDMVLNLSLGILLPLFPTKISNMMLLETSLPEKFLITIIGLGLLLFGLWQITLVSRKEIGVNALKFLGFAAILPAILLSLFLILGKHLISDLGLYLMIIGDLYMYVIGFLYLKTSSRAAIL